MQIKHHKCIKTTVCVSVVQCVHPRSEQKKLNILNKDRKKAAVRADMLVSWRKQEVSQKGGGDHSSQIQVRNPLTWSFFIISSFSN